MVAFSIATKPFITNKKEVEVMWSDGQFQNGYKAGVYRDENCTLSTSTLNITTTSTKAKVESDGDFYFCVFGLDANGGETAATNNGLSFTIDTIDPTVNNAPELVTLAKGTTTSIVIEWEPASDNKSAAATLVYEVFYSESAVAKTVDTIENTSSGGKANGGSVSTEVTGLTPGTQYYFYIVVTDQAGNKAVYPVKQASTSSTPPNPRVGNDGQIVVSNIEESSLKLTWTPATDDSTPAADLQYAVWRSAEQNINSPGDIEANGTLEKNFEGNYTTFSATGLSPSSTYYFNIVVKDNDGNKSSYRQIATATLPASSPAIDPSLTVTISSSQDPGPTSGTPLNLTVKFAKNVSGFELSDINVTNGTPGNFNVVDAKTYTFDITQPSTTVTADIASAVAQDSAGNQNAAATPWNIEFVSIPASDLTSLAAGDNLRGINLQWLPSDSSKSFLVARGISPVTFNPTDGYSCSSYEGTQGLEEVFCVDDSYTFFDKELSNGTYHYGVWAISITNNYSQKTSVSGQVLLISWDNGGFEQENFSSWDNALFPSFRRWSISSESPDEGSFSARSGEYSGPSNPSCISRNIDLSSSPVNYQLEFSWKIESGSGQDANFKLAGSVVSTLDPSDPADAVWHKESHTLNAGVAYIAKWCFSDNVAGAGVGCDCVRLDAVKVETNISAFTAPTNITLEPDYEKIDLVIGAAEGAAGYLVVRNTSPVTFRPVDGTTYTGAVSGGMVIYSGISTVISDTSLTNSTDYHYSIWAYDASNNYSVAMSDSTKAGVADVQNLLVSASNTALDLSWNIDDGNVTSYLVVRSTGSPPTFSPTDSNSYSIGSVAGGEIVYAGSSPGFQDTGLTNNVTYYYKVWSRNSFNQYSAVEASSSGTPASCPGNFNNGACWITTPGNTSCASACSNASKAYDSAAFTSLLGDNGNSDLCRNALVAVGYYSGSFSGGTARGDTASMACGWDENRYSHNVYNINGITDGSYADFSDSVTQICPCN